MLPSGSSVTLYLISNFKIAFSLVQELSDVIISDSPKGNKITVIIAKHKYSIKLINLV